MAGSAKKVRKRKSEDEEETAPAKRARHIDPNQWTVPIP